MKNKLTKDEVAELIPLIKAVLESGEEWNAEALHHPAGAIIDAVLTIPGMKKKKDDDSGNGEGFDTNGWQYDWWQTFVYKDKDYTLSGSGYYGGHTFGLADS